MDNTKLTALLLRRTSSNQRVTQMMKFRRISCKMMYIVGTSSQMTSGSLWGRNHLPLCSDGGDDDDDSSLHFTGCRFTSEWIWNTSYGFRYCVYFKSPLSSSFLLSVHKSSFSLKIVSPLLTVIQIAKRDTTPIAVVVRTFLNYMRRHRHASGPVSNLTFQGVCKSSIFIIHGNGFEGRVIAGDNGNKTH